MKNLKFYFYIILFSLMFTSCGQQGAGSNNNTSAFSNGTKDTSIVSNGESFDLGQGYNSMAYIFTTPCTQGTTVQIPQSANQAVVTFQNDESEEDLLNQIDLDLSATIPIQGMVNLTPELEYARDAAKTTLSHTTTYQVYVELGDKKLIPTQPQILSNYENDFDSQGNLTNVSDFMNQCGDQIIASERLSSKIIVTAKLYFQSESDIQKFEASLGVSPTIDPNMSINVKISDIDSNIRQRITMSLFAYQIGGNPTHLASIVSSNSCTLDNITACQAMFDKISAYISGDYVTQLDPTNINVWNIESIQTVPYDQLKFTNHNGQLLNFNATSGTPNIQQLSVIRNNINNRILAEYKNNSLANAMLQSNDLTTDETASLNNIVTNSNQNIQNLRLFSQTCYSNIPQCFTNYNSGYVNTIVVTYDTSVLTPNMGKLIASVYSNTVNASYLDDRSSADFAQLNPDLANGVYSSYYFKFKTLQNVLISNPSVYVNIKCDFTYWFPGTLLTQVFPKYEVTNATLTINYNQNCSNQYPIYIAAPTGFDTLLGAKTQFIVEMWGRN